MRHSAAASLGRRRRWGTRTPDSSGVPRIAQDPQRVVRKERVEHTLQPTALVHEAYLRLVDARIAQWQDRAHFFAVCAQSQDRGTALLPSERAGNRSSPQDLRTNDSPRLEAHPLVARTRNGLARPGEMKCDWAGASDTKCEMKSSSSWPAGPVKVTARGPSDYTNLYCPGTGSGGTGRLSL